MPPRVLVAGGGCLSAAKARVRLGQQVTPCSGVHSILGLILGFSRPGLEIGLLRRSWHHTRVDALDVEYGYMPAVQSTV